MKAYRILAGVAAAALMSTAAQAGDVYHASMAIPAGNPGPIVVINGTNYVVSNNGLAQTFNDTTYPLANAYLRGASSQVMNSNATVSMIEITGRSEGNNGTAETSVTNSFSINGNVTPDCSFFVGNVDRNINFGTIGIEARDNVGSASAFDMTAPANAKVQTNVAGCNTKNRVTVAKGRATGMVSNNTSGFDSAQFTNELDYTVAASWAGSNPTGGSQTATSEVLNVGLNTLNNTRDQGAWKSVFTLDVNVPVPTKSLLSGDYADTITVTLGVI